MVNPLERFPEVNPNECELCLIACTSLIEFVVGRFARILQFATTSVCWCRRASSENRLVLLLLCVAMPDSELGQIRVAGLIAYRERCDKIKIMKVKIVGLLDPASVIGVPTRAQLAPRTCLYFAVLSHVRVNCGARSLRSLVTFIIPLEPLRRRCDPADGGHIKLDNDVATTTRRLISVINTISASYKTRYKHFECCINFTCAAYFNTGCHHYRFAHFSNLLITRVIGDTAFKTCLREVALHNGDLIRYQRGLSCNGGE